MGKSLLLKENLPIRGPKASQDDFRSFIGYLVAIEKEARKSFGGFERGAAGDEWKALERALKQWLQSQYDPSLYENMMTCLEKGGKSELALVMRSVLHTGNRRILNYYWETGTWVFNLTEQEGRVAESAVEHARALVCVAYQGVKSLVDTDVSKTLVANYFCKGSLHAPVRQKALTDVRDVLKKTKHGLMTQPAHFVICPPTDVMCRSASGTRDGIACVGTQKNAVGGPTIHLFQKFFSNHPGDAGNMEYHRACTMLHEATHNFANTEDVKNKKCYGRFTCFCLDQELALKNADSYGLFAYDLDYRWRHGDWSKEFQNAKIEADKANDPFKDAKLVTW